MKKVSIKEVTNGFLVNIQDPEYERATAQMQYSARSSNEYIFDTIQAVSDFLLNVYKTGSKPDGK